MNSRRLQAEIETHSSGALLPPTQKTSLATPYDANYDRYLIDFGIFLFSRGPKPENWSISTTEILLFKISVFLERF